MGSGDSCFGARPQVPTKGHKGDGEPGEVRMPGEWEQMACREKEEL